MLFLLSIFSRHYLVGRLFCGLSFLKNVSLVLGMRLVMSADALFFHFHRRHESNGSCHDENIGSSGFHCSILTHGFDLSVLRDESRRACVLRRLCLSSAPSFELAEETFLSSFDRFSSYTDCANTSLFPLSLSRRSSAESSEIGSAAF